MSENKETRNAVKAFVESFKFDAPEEEYRKKISELVAVIADTPFSQEELKSMQGEINAIDETIFKSYLPQIDSNYTPIPPNDPLEEPSDDLEKIREAHQSQYSGVMKVLKINRWVIDSTENNLDKLKNTYNALWGTPCSFALIFHRKKTGCDVYAAILSTDESKDPSVVQKVEERFKQALRGNFPGVAIDPAVTDLKQTPIGTFTVTGKNRKKALAVVTNIATEKSDKFVSQGIEKLIDAYTPHEKDGSDEYLMMLLCEPLSAEDIGTQRQTISARYQALSPFITWQTNKNFTDTIGFLKGAAHGAALGANVGLNVGPVNAGIHGDVNFNANIGYNEGKSAGKSETLTFTNHQVKTILERLDEQMQRLTQCEALGMWRFAAYIISDNYATAKNIAQLYRSLTQGEASFIEKTAVNVWGSGDADINETLDALFFSLAGLVHPQFKKKLKDPDEAPVSATSFISGLEVARALNMPQRSIPGLPVFQCAQFARNVVHINTAQTAGKDNEKDSAETNYGKDAAVPLLPLGHIFHMRSEGTSDVSLDVNSLASHTFITGSTGSGKSNTIYHMLKGLNKNFLVIEPAKGEYKDALYEESKTEEDKVKVFGTNPCKTELLRLNPFSFPHDIHVLEHIDRLIEVFNACWPMYAAMPAVLKAAVEQAYYDVGWDLSASTHVTRQFPTFLDVMNALPTVIDSKGFSVQTQGDYRGALLTRVESLTNGINGQVLCATQELSNADLFDSKTIVDLSRVGSMETKALLMGILVLKLQEHRMNQRAERENEANSELKHITVLEEAHNLLRRTAAEQSQESSNLQGKSVEMLTNAIAEMRSYGEGFIIADQSPGLLDMAVIRNTNTKIIMRLPDEGDRVLVGKAAGLTDEQIVELSKLETGVAAVYQNEWLEPVLCKVCQYRATVSSGYKYKPLEPVQPPHGKFLAYLIAQLDEGFSFEETSHFTQDEIDQISRWIDGRHYLPMSVKDELRNALGSKQNEKIVWRALYDIAHGKSVLCEAIASKQKDMAWIVADRLIQKNLMIDSALAQQVRAIIFQYAIDLAPNDVEKEKFRRHGGLF